MPSLVTRTPLAQLLAARICKQGPITFAEYMSECLYHPEYGYYSRTPARRYADFYTSVDVHPVFGRLFARQLNEMWVLLGQPESFWVVEAGAGTGCLAKHILDFAELHLPEFFSTLRYVAVERSAARRAVQANTIGAYLDSGRAFSVPTLPDEIGAGCVFSNELLDAFPVHRVLRTPSELREIYVDLEDDGFCERLGKPSTPALEEYFLVQGVHLMEGQQAEAGLEACHWIEDIGRRLGRGFVVTIDYGHEAHELYNERHVRGTLLAYQEHHASEDFYRAPGEQDLTAHVNFSALDLWGHRVGLLRSGLGSQTRFLVALGRANEFADLYEEGQSEIERLRARLLLKNLIFPEGMGEAFEVFIQHKNVEGARLTGLAPF